MSQRRADAAVLMAETSLQNASRDFATADRYQVIVSVDASELSAVDTSVTAVTADWDISCTQTHHLHIHHLRHWADGGATSVQNGATLCSSHHALVHEGGYSIKRVENNDQQLHEKFVQQQHTADISQFDVEKILRNDKESFNTVRTLSPECYRFRVVDAQGQDIHHQSDADISDGRTRSTFGPDDYTRVECGEPVPDYCHGGIRDRHAPSFTSETSARYAINARRVPNTLCH